eukprot:sb/3475093/
MTEFLQTLEKYHPIDEDYPRSNHLSGPANLNQNLERFREFRKSKEVVDEINRDDTIPFMAEINELSVMTREERKQHTENWDDLMCRDKNGNCRIESYGWVAKFTCTYGRCKKAKLTDYKDDEDGIGERNY